MSPASTIIWTKCWPNPVLHPVMRKIRAILNAVWMDQNGQETSQRVECERSGYAGIHHANSQGDVWHNLDDEAKSHPFPIRFTEKPWVPVKPYFNCINFGRQVTVLRQLYSATYRSSPSYSKIKYDIKVWLTFKAVVSNSVFERRGPVSPCPIAVPCYPQAHLLGLSLA